jgi:hypothetical protein
MKIFEVEEDPAAANGKKLAAISMFLSSRAGDEAAKKEISQDAFIDIAKSMGVNVTSQNLGDLISQEPLSNILEPLDPNSGVVRFLGNEDPATTNMSVDQAQNVVNQNAKAAMRRGMK